MQNKKQVIIYVVVVFLALVWMKQYKTIGQQKDAIADYEYSLVRYERALEEANNNIEEANSTIEDAQGSAWSSYEDMGYALDNLYTVDTVSGPGW